MKEKDCSKQTKCYLKKANLKRSPRKQQKFCQKVKREKTEDQTRRSSILKIRALRKVNRGNEWGVNQRINSRNFPKTRGQFPD